MTAGLKALVTGAGGFLGGWLCEELAAAGVETVALDRDYSHARQATTKQSIERISADIENFEQLQQILEQKNIGFIFHLAAQALVKVAAADPMSTFKANIEGTWNVLEAARRISLKGARRIEGVIVASSDKAYGDQENLPYTEDFPLQGRYPYDVSKSCADLLAKSYFASFGLPVCVTRCGNLYGGGDFAVSRVVPGTILSALRGERPVIRSDGTPVRDYVYVKDAAQALLLISRAMASDPSIHGEAFNISCEEPISVIDIVSKILVLMNKNDLQPLVLNNATLEIQAQYLSSKKIRQRLAWRPLFDLAGGLKETIDWYSRHFDGNAFNFNEKLAKDEA